MALEFVVANVKYPVVSLGKLVDVGFEIRFPASSRKGELVHPNGLVVPLKQEKHTWSVDAVVMESSQAEWRR
eukprot:5763763-Amphidinium_carterae.1